jgi:tetratricopeptide (TPR) repeat protein
MFSSRVVFLTLAALAVPVALMAQSANPKPPKAKSNKEVAAVNAMFQAQAPDDQIAAAQNLIQHFADSDFRGSAFFVMANAADEKRDYVNVVVYAEQAVAADPLNFGAMALMARAIAMGTKKFDLDKADKQARVEKLSKDALDLYKKAPKPNPQLTDEQWAAACAGFAQPAQESLGYLAMVNEDWASCATNFKLAVDMTPDPDPSVLVRLGNCDRQAKKYDDAIAALDRAINDPHAAPIVKKVATQEKQLAEQAKAAGK